MNISNHFDSRGRLVHITIIVENCLITKVSCRSSDRFEWTIHSDGVSEQTVNLINEWVNEYLRGVEPSISLPFLLEGMSSFKLAVLSSLQKITFGNCCSYSMLAGLTGSPLAMRAVGTACKSNPYPFFIPCHRIIRADGTLGGYNFGVEVKKRLLAFENIVLA